MTRPHATWSVLQVRRAAHDTSAARHHATTGQPQAKLTDMFSRCFFPASKVSGWTPDLLPFKVLQPVGRGAVGEVFLCRHSGDGQLYAVKVVPLDAPAWRLELLKREERMYAALVAEAGAHVGLLRPCRMELLPGYLCLVTEWASGGTLASFLSSRKFRRGVPEHLSALLMRQLVAAVERLHIHRVVCRDVKARQRPRRRRHVWLRPSAPAARGLWDVQGAG